MFVGVFAIGLALAISQVKRFGTRVWFIFALFCVIFFQAYIHQGMRSPYTYIPHFEQPASNKYWYHEYLFEGFRGPVNEDYHAFWPSEEVFMGGKKPLSTLATRLFPFFISSQFTRFVSAYYVWLVINLACWSLGVGAIYLIAREWFSVRASRIACFLTAVAQGPIVYVAQAKPYVFGMMGIAVMLAAYLRLFRIGRFRPRNAIVFGAFLGLFLLSYEHQPWLVALPIIALMTARSLPWTIISISMGLVISASFSLLAKSLPVLTVLPTLAGLHPLTSIKDLILSGNVGRFLTRIWRSIIGFIGSMFAAFQFMFIISLVRFRKLWRDESKRVIACFFVPSLLTYFLFEMAASFYVAFPRLVYPAYPGIFIIVGWSLDALWSWERHGKPVGKWLAGGFLFWIAFHATIDVFGYPWTYYYWFYRNLGHSW